MRSKIVWLSFYVTMVYWLGGILGCATSSHDTQNYQILNEQQDLFHPEDHSPTSSLPLNKQASPISSATMVMRQSWMSLNRQTTTAVHLTARKSSDVSRNTPRLLFSQTHSVVGIDRSAWPHVKVTPEVGVTEHWPEHFRDLSIRSSARARFDFDQPLEQQMRAALSGVSPPLGNFDELVDIVLEPGKFYMDVATMPVFGLLLEPIWINTRTPDTTSKTIPKQTDHTDQSSQSDHNTPSS